MSEPPSSPKRTMATTAILAPVGNTTGGFMRINRAETKGWFKKESLSPLNGSDRHPVLGETHAIVNRAVTKAKFTRPMTSVFNFTFMPWFRSVTQHALSQSLPTADALIAATALEHGLPLLTGNVKRFKPVAGLELIAFKP